MQEHVKQQHDPLKIYRTDERFITAVPMTGLEPENILVNAVCANVTYDNGVLMVVLPISTPDIPRTIDARIGQSYTRATQRQRRPPCDLRFMDTFKGKSGSRHFSPPKSPLRIGVFDVCSSFPRLAC